MQLLKKDALIFWLVTPFFNAKFGIIAINKEAKIRNFIPFIVNVGLSIFKFPIHLTHKFVKHWMVGKIWSESWLGGHSFQNNELYQNSAQIHLIELAAQFFNDESEKLLIVS